MSDDKTSKRLILGRTVPAWIAIVVLLVILFGIALPSHGPQKGACPMNSAEQMKQIAIAAVLYQTDHKGNYPERLSLLVPDYIAETRIFFFRCNFAAAFVPANADRDPKLIDVFSPYSILQLGAGRALIFERLPMWSDHTVGFVVFSNQNQSANILQRSRLSQEEFEKQYLQAFKP